MFELASDKAYAALAEKLCVSIWPSPAAFRAMPNNSLGAGLQRRCGIQGLAPVFLVVRDGGTDAEYIDDRLRSTHDLWHLVLGLPDSVGGETAISAAFVNGRGSRSATDWLGARTVGRSISLIRQH